VNKLVELVFFTYMNSLVWRIGLILLLILGWWWWRGSRLVSQNEQAAPTPTAASVNPGGARAEEFLEESGIEIPEDNERVVLDAVGGGENTGVMAWSSEGAQATVTVIASLPDLQTGTYAAWLSFEDEFTRIGNLRLSKSGYLLDTRVEARVIEQAQRVIVSRETGVDRGEPVDRVLEGRLE
jgi:hypothetical protein